MQRASPASTRCSGDHASSSGSGEPPSSLRASRRGRPRPRTRTSSRRVATRGNLHSPHVARDPRCHGVHGPPRARRGPAGRAPGAARRAAPRGARRACRAGRGGARRRRSRRGVARRGLRRCERGRVARRPVPRARPRARSGRDGRGRPLPRHERRAGVRAARSRSGSRRTPVVLPAFGFDYVPGDLAARLAAEQVEGPLDEVVVAYSVKGVGTSRGTRRTIGHVMGQKQVAWQDGRLVPSRFGATTRTIRFPFGERTVVEWGGTEPITVPRHTDVATCARTSARRRSRRRPAAWAGSRRRSSARLPVRPVRAVGGVPAEEPLHGRRRGARPRRQRTRRARGHATSTA